MSAISDSYAREIFTSKNFSFYPHKSGRWGGITYLLFSDETKQSIIGIPAYPMTETMRYRYDESSPLKESDYVDIYIKKKKKNT